MKRNPVFYFRYKAVVKRIYHGETIDRTYFADTLEELQDKVHPILQLDHILGVKYYKLSILEEELWQD